MKTFKWTVPEAERHDPRGMTTGEFAYWGKVRARGPEWFAVHKGLVFLAILPGASGWLEGSGAGSSLGTDLELAMASWIGGTLCGMAVWFRRERRFAYSRDEGMRLSDQESDG